VECHELCSNKRLRRQVAQAALAGAAQLNATCQSAVIKNIWDARPVQDHASSLALPVSCLHRNTRVLKVSETWQSK
jgi:hypothetical protein